MFKLSSPYINLSSNRKPAVRVKYDIIISRKLLKRTNIQSYPKVIPVLKKKLPAWIIFGTFLDKISL